MPTLIHGLRSLSVLAALVALTGLVGCSSEAGPSAAGKDVLLEAEPADAQDLADFKASLSTGIGSGGQATIVGRVGSGGKEPWDTTQATFLLTSISLEDESHDHGGSDHSDCKFCQAKELETMTLVRIVDETGAVIPMDARKLLGMKEKQIVVASGQGILDDGKLFFDASKIFIRE